MASASQGCTYDGTLTPPATIPTKTGYTFKGWTVRGLPDGYTRLEYIQSSGTQYINTGVQYNSSKPIVLILTAKSDYSTTSNHVALGFGGLTGQWFGLNSQKWTIGTGGVSTVLATNKTSNIEITWTGGKEYLKIAGVSIGSRSTTNTTNNLWLFGCQGETSRFRGTIYSVQIFVDNVLVKDFIPAKNSSNVVGMYDTVSKTFFTNVGTGSFTAGAVVE
ncbi:MAG: InlB B-repeat-containing protein [Alphaproteobacteria bacterium]|nr:InlB B-repeat-containing protein [Alphaproteobacteria bacterium]